MAKFRVKALYVGGLKKKIFRSGDIVTSDHFPRGRAQELEKDGFLERITDVKTENATPDNVINQPEPSGDPMMDVLKKKIRNDIDGKTKDDYTAKELREKLEMIQVDYAPNDNKTKLFELLSSGLTD